MQVDGKNMSGSLVDFGLYFFHNAKALLAKGSGPYFYLPKMESYLEARLWNDVFVFAQNISAFQMERLKQLCYWKRFTLRLKWMKFCMS